MTNRKLIKLVSFGLAMGSLVPLGAFFFTGSHFFTLGYFSMNLVSGILVDLTLNRELTGYTVIYATLVSAVGSSLLGFGLVSVVLYFLAISIMLSYFFQNMVEVLKEINEE